VIHAMFFWLMLGASVFLIIWMSCDILFGPSQEPQYSVPDIVSLRHSVQGVR
jgi:hypothetical protein